MKQLIPVELTREEIRTLPVDTQRRILSQQARSIAKFTMPVGGERRVCFICKKKKPWGTFNMDTGNVVCKDCRDKVRAAKMDGR